MTSDVVNGLLIVGVISLSTVLLCPVLTWLLPNRTKASEA